MNRPRQKIKPIDSFLKLALTLNQRALTIVCSDKAACRQRAHVCVPPQESSYALTCSIDDRTSLNFLMHHVFSQDCKNLLQKSCFADECKQSSRIQAAFDCPLPGIHFNFHTDTRTRTKSIAAPSKPACVASLPKAILCPTPTRPPYLTRTCTDQIDRCIKQEKSTFQAYVGLPPLLGVHFCPKIDPHRCHLNFLRVQCTCWPQLQR